MLSGLWHHTHLSGHPLKNTVVRIPGPSCTAFLLIPDINPVILLLYQSVIFIIIPAYFDLPDPAGMFYG